MKLLARRFCIFVLVVGLKSLLAVAAGNIDEQTEEEGEEEADFFFAQRQYDSSHQVERGDEGETRHNCVLCITEVFTPDYPSSRPRQHWIRYLCDQGRLTHGGTDTTTGLRNQTKFKGWGFIKRDYCALNNCNRPEHNALVRKLGLKLPCYFQSRTAARSLMGEGDKPGTRAMCGSHCARSEDNTGAWTYSCYEPRVKVAAKGCREVRDRDTIYKDQIGKENARRLVGGFRFCWCSKKLCNEKLDLGAVFQYSRLREEKGGGKVRRLSLAKETTGRGGGGSVKGRSSLGLNVALALIARARNQWQKTFSPKSYIDG